MVRTFLRIALIAAALATGALSWAADPPAQPFELTILHVNDTHSMLDPSLVKLTVDLDGALSAKTVYVEMGGFPAAMAAVSGLRAGSTGGVLFLHAGDLFQGSLYFTEYLGAADVDFWNAMHLDVATLGNHEFDKGPGLIQTALLDKASFGITCANVDVSREPAITAPQLLRPYVIREIAGQKVGIIGVTNPSTADISSPGKRMVFSDPAASVNRAVTELEGHGVNKIVVLSHLGYDADRTLASRIHGVDVIVGGHSHTLLGSYPSVGLRGIGQYPTAVRDAQGADVLIVQAWQWAYQIGRIRLSFDAQGKVTGYDARPVFVANTGFAQIHDLPNLRGEKKRVQFVMRGGTLEIAEYDGTRYSIAVTDSRKDQYDAYAADYHKLAAKLSADPSVAWVAPDPAGQAKLASYSGGILSFKNKVVATVTEEMRRGHNRGPGPVIADAMTWKTGAQVGMVNPGGVRQDLASGDLTLARVYELQPFGDTLITANVTGDELLRVLEDAADFTITSYGTRAGTHLLYVSGVTLSLDTRVAKGKRVSDVRVKQAGGTYAPLSLQATYSLVVNSFMAGGGDRNTTLAGLTGKYDTGYIDAEAFADYVEGRKLANVTEERVKLTR